MEVRVFDLRAVIQWKAEETPTEQNVLQIYNPKPLGQVYVLGTQSFSVVLHFREVLCYTRMPRVTRPVEAGPARCPRTQWCLQQGV